MSGTEDDRASGSPENAWGPPPAWVHEPPMGPATNPTTVYPNGMPPRAQYFPPPPPPPRRNTALIAGGVAVVALLTAVLVLVIVTRGSSDSGTPTTAEVSSAESSAATTRAAPKTTHEGDLPAPAPVIDGYQSVFVPSRGVAYDVPADWDVASQGTIGGTNGVIGKGVADYDDGYCGNWVKAMSVLITAGQPDPTAAAIEVGRRASSGYNSPDIKSSPAVPFQSRDGQSTGVFVETSGSLTSTESCAPPRFSVFTFAVPNGPDTDLMVIVADRGVSGELTTDDAKTIFSSIRKPTG
ncbi:hypothetical protein JGU71_13805 [Antrihabitans sp. YC3-6]|uniref:DUF8017 domain-containing protein n=1 Tax=Antrihabitans stalagmiti TaxID=2799499 RepID=A0A934NRK5_9NOCA|nr:hypothetical protein [Antrihabitans stalagmiti]MBJ8339967.1 hypothetical protein [Antrihabitans stalagmiti]